jgi:hypothetical protein
MKTSQTGQARTPGPRIVREQATMAAMMAIYCRDHHPKARGLCEDCVKLLDYAQRRLDTCPFGEDKPGCTDCQVHCFSASQREAVRVVMRYAGPRMLLRHPILSIYHLLAKRREAPSLEALRQERKAAGSSKAPDTLG